MDNQSTALRKRDQNATNPIKMFAEWLKQAESGELNDPTAMSLATVDQYGMPNCRMVLMRGFDESGIVFFTNFESQKGDEILSSKKAATCFHWKSIRKSVRFRGSVEQVSDAEADDYFNSRARGSRIGAWASRQSRPLEDRLALEKQVAKYTAKFAVGKIPRPEYWSGFRIKPLSIEFWSDGKFRLHERLRFDRETLQSEWTTERLYP